MLKETPIIVYAAEGCGNAANCLYPKKLSITDSESAETAFSVDCVFAEYKNRYRSGDNFLRSNALPFDCDNDHTDTPSEWITPADIAEFFCGVPHVIHYSRHHLKQKGDKTPRPRFHVIFLIASIESKTEYATMKKRVLAVFPYFDSNATDSARFFFGTEDPQVEVTDGTVTLDEFLAGYEAEKYLLSLPDHSIPEGQRNSTLSRIGAKIIKRFGDTPEAYEMFLAQAEKCNPPLDTEEVERIWNGKKRLFQKIEKSAGYLPPEKYGQTAPVWETPIPFDEYELPAFPVNALPPVIARYVAAVAQSTQTSADMAAVESLGVLGMCTQGKYYVQGNADWSEPLNLYTAVILPPAERKSSVFAHMMFPVEEYECEVNEAMSAEILEGQMRLEALEKEKRVLIDKVSKGKATSEDLQKKAVEMAKYKPPKALRLFVDDVTSEKLTSVLAENGGRAAVVSAEGGIFDILGGLYTKTVNIDVFLKGHSGDTIRVDRIGRASESILHPALTILLAVQPEVLNGMISNGTFRGRGLTARFLYSMPKSSVGTRSFKTTAIPKNVKNEYSDLVKTILSNTDTDEALSLSDDAAEVLEALFNEVESRLRGDLADIADWAGKFVGAVLRIAGLLHIAQNRNLPQFNDIQQGTMENAVKIGRYFLEHAKAAYSLMGADPVNKNAEFLLSAIKRDGLTEFSRRDAMRLCRRFKTAESLQPVLSRLCEYGYIAQKPAEPTFGTGRRPSEVYLTNPFVLTN